MIVFSRAKSAFGEKFDNNLTLLEQKMKARKRKLESEPVLPQKKVRFQKRVSENCFHLNLTNNKTDLNLLKYNKTENFDEM